MGVFNKEKLRAEIIKQWGKYGAHIEVYDALLKENETLKNQVDNLGLSGVSSSFSAVGISDIGKAIELVKERERGIIIISTDTPEIPKNKIDDITFKLTDIDRSSTQIFLKPKSKYHK